MLSSYYTMSELQSMKFRELPNYLYDRILADIKRQIGIMTSRINAILDKSNVTELDQYCNIYKYIRVI